MPALWPTAYHPRRTTNDLVPKTQLALLTTHYRLQSSWGMQPCACNHVPATLCLQPYAPAPAVSCQ